MDVSGDRESDEGQDSTRSNEAFELEHGALSPTSTGWANALLARSSLFSGEIMPPSIGPDPRVTIRRAFEASSRALR
jgi:hypothetical protein